MTAARFVGIDLAWRAHHPTGWAVLEGDARRVRLVDSRAMGADAEILGALAALDGQTHVAIDAPLVVPNRRGHRPGDRALAARFARYRAAPHVASQERLLHEGRIRSVAFAEALEALGFAHDPRVDSRAMRRFFEVYPHPAIVSLLGLQERLPYKARFPRDVRLAAFDQLVAGLRAQRRPRLDLGDHALSPAGLRGRALKSLEDRLDAIVCAYVAARWTMRPEGCEMFGTLEEGYVVTPVPLA